MKRILPYATFALCSAIAVALLLLVVDMPPQQRVRNPPQQHVRNPPQHPVQHPNVLLILIDTLRASNLSLFDYSRPTSPNIDAFAAKSIVFRNVSSVGGNTPTSMAGLMSGRYPFFELDAQWNDSTSHGMARFYTWAGFVRTGTRSNA